MIECKNFQYKKEFKELIETFIPNSGDKGPNILFEKDGLLLKLQIGDYKDKIPIEDYFLREDSNIKRGIYQLLSNYSNQELDWGMLVGVNPLKLFAKLEGQWCRVKANSILQHGYFLDENKINLGYSVLENQKPMRKKLEGKASIFINIPFCPSRCSYCSYATYRTNEEDIEKYLKMLQREIEEISKRSKINPQSIYIGGGTPSSIGAKNLDKILRTVSRCFPKSEEFTVEIGRPDTINKEILSVLKSWDVDRISINSQTMKEETLRALGRNHTVSEVYDAFELARNLGFKNINTDLIIGLPKETPEDFLNSLEKINNLNPESISIHTLSLKRGSKLTSLGYQGDKYNEFQKIRDEFVDNNGYLPYYLYRQKQIYMNMENIGYSKLGYESIYNIGMMEDIHHIIGFGLGSTTKILKGNKILRHMNYRSLEDYVKNINKNIEDKIKLFGGNFQ